MVHFLSESQIASLLPDLSTEEQEEVNEVITKLIHEYCNTTFEARSREERYDSRVELLLEHRPIISVSELTDNGIALVEDVDFFVYTDKVILDRPSGKRKGVRIVYNSGFTEVPQTVKEVAFELFRYRVFTATEGSLLFYKTQRIEERMYERDPDLDEETILSRLSPWVQPVSRDLKGRSELFRVGVI